MCGPETHGFLTRASSFPAVRCMARARPAPLSEAEGLVVAGSGRALGARGAGRASRLGVGLGGTAGT